MAKSDNSGRNTVSGHQDTPIVSSGTDTHGIVLGQTANPDFIPTLKHLSRPLCKIFSFTSALVHPSFPGSLFQFHLLTNNQLDDLARHYHQVWPPTPETFQYPTSITAWVGTPDEHIIDIETKRRRIGCFIGLAGCENLPRAEPCFDTPATDEFNDNVHDGENARIEDMMNYEWKEALRQAKHEDSSNVFLPPKTGGC